MKNKYMQMALEEAKKAFDQDEVPVGAVIVKDDAVIAKAFNTKEKNNNTICHAEILAITEASKKINNWRLDDCEMYVTLEPCPMCASAIQQSRISKVYYGLKNEDPKNSIILDMIFSNSKTNKGVSVEYTFSVEIKELLQSFFNRKR